MKTCAIIIPCFNEASIIGSSLIQLTGDLARIQNIRWHIVCVDDGSSDGTSDIIRGFISTFLAGQSTVQLIVLEKNSGKGAAIQAGLRASTADIYGYMDADLSIIYATALEKIIELLRVNDLVVGRRIQKYGSGYSMMRAAASHVFSWVAFKFFNIPAHDVQCGFKFFTEPAKKIALAVTQPKFSFDLEFLSRAHRAKISIAEIYVAWQHRTQSRVEFFDGFYYIKDAAHVFFRR